MGLIHQPRILFLDEPTLGLDVQTRQKMWNYIKRLNEEKGVTVFMTTHYLEEADSLCDRIAIIDAGVIKVLGSPSQLKEKVGGDVLTLRLSSNFDATNLLRNIDGVSDVARQDGVYRIKILRVGEVLPSIIEEIVRKDLAITQIDLAKPTLNQVFLEVTGSSMRDEAANGDPFGQRVLIERLK